MPVWEWLVLVPAGAMFLALGFILVDIGRRARKLPRAEEGTAKDGFGAFLADLFLPFWRDWP